MNAIEKMKLILFVDDSPASEEARKAFQERDVELTTVRASGHSLPSARIGNTVYPGRWGIHFLLSALPRREASCQPAEEESE